MLSRLPAKTSMLRRAGQKPRNYYVRVWYPDEDSDLFGHTSIATTEDERKRFGLAEAYGHNPESRRQRRQVAIIQIPDPEGGEGTVGSYVYNAAEFPSEHRINGWDESIDMGPLDAKQAGLLAEYRAPPYFELTSHDPNVGTNCVYETRSVVALLEGKSLPHIPGEEPQDLAKRISLIAADKRDLGKKLIRGLIA